MPPMPPGQVEILFWASDINSYCRALSKATFIQAQSMRKIYLQGHNFQQLYHPQNGTVLLFLMFDITYMYNDRCAKS